MPYNLLYSLPFNLPYNMPPGCALETETCTSGRRSRGLERADYFSTRPPRALRTSAKSHRRTTGTRKPAGSEEETRRNGRAAGREERGREEQRTERAGGPTTASKTKRPKSTRAEETEEQPKHTTKTRHRQTTKHGARQGERKRENQAHRQHEAEPRQDREGRGVEQVATRAAERKRPRPANAERGANKGGGGGGAGRGARRARLGGCPEHPPCGRPAAGADAFRRVESQCSRSHERGGGLRVATRCTGKQLRDLAVGHQGSFRGATARAVTGNGARSEFRRRGSRARAKHPWRS